MNLQAQTSSGGDAATGHHIKASEGMMGSMGGRIGEMSMPMTISWNTECVMFLFEGFHAGDTLQFILGCTGVFVLAVLGQLMLLPVVKAWMVGP